MGQLRINIFMLVLAATVISMVRADLLDCEEKLPTAIAEFGRDLGDKVADATGTDITASSGEHQVRDFFKSVGCQIKSGASKVGEQAKKLGAEIREGAKKLSEKAKDLGSDIKDRFGDFRDKLTQDSAEEMTKDRGFLSNVEMISPDIVMGEQQCGHGHVLDALGNCSKLRK